MTVAIWIAIASAFAVVVGQWGTGRLFTRLKTIEDRQDRIDRHLEAVDEKNWNVQTRLTVLETIEGIHKKEKDPWQRS